MGLKIKKLLLKGLFYAKFEKLSYGLIFVFLDLAIPFVTPKALNASSITHLSCVTFSFS